MAKGPPFGAIPLHALSDRRLSELHLRTLGIVSYHDRMSLVKGAGQGCWASSATMAEELGSYNVTNVSTAISQLEKWGYLHIEKRPGDKRLKVYRVQFVPPDSLPPRQTTEHQHDGDRLPTGKEPQKVVCPPEWSSPWNNEANPPQYISQSEERDFAEARKEIPLKGRDLSFSAKDGAEAPAASVSLLPALSPHFGKLSPAAQLVRFEEAFNDIGRDVDALDPAERSAWSEWLWKAADEFAGDPVGYHAQRLCEEVMPF